MKRRSNRNFSRSQSPTREDIQRLRVFVSYSRQDRPLVRVIVKALRNNVIPMWDENFRYGHGFHEQIKGFIAHAHVFLPVITEASSKRGWVHQEIGYAMALNIPVLPITVGATALPSEMIQSLQAVRLTEDTKRWADQLKRQLTLDIFEHLVGEFADQEHASFQCAEHTEDRARLMVKYADEVRRMGHYGLVRQAGALSSFHIPREPLAHPVWQWRAGKIPYNSFLCHWQREERIALEKHARRCGCRLIINPTLSFRARGIAARIVRLRWLVKFLKSMPPRSVQVAVVDALPADRSTTIVGNWFAAEAVSAAIGHGYRHTIFTRHAPSVQHKIELFDEEFNEALKRDNWKPAKSHNRAIRKLQKLIAQLERDKGRGNGRKARRRRKNKPKRKGSRK